jgi:hypothetical protein
MSEIYAADMFATTRQPQPPFKVARYTVPGCRCRASCYVRSDQPHTYWTKIGSSRYRPFVPPLIHKHWAPHHWVCSQNRVARIDDLHNDPLCGCPVLRATFTDGRIEERSPQAVAVFDGEKIYELHNSQLCPKRRSSPEMSASSSSSSSSVNRDTQHTPKDDSPSSDKSRRERMDKLKQTLMRSMTVTPDEAGNVTVLVPCHDPVRDGRGISITIDQSFKEYAEVREEIRREEEVRLGCTVVVKEKARGSTPTQRYINDNESAKASTPGRRLTMEVDTQSGDSHTGLGSSKKRTSSSILTEEKEQEPVATLATQYKNTPWAAPGQRTLDNGIKRRKLLLELKQVLIERMATNDLDSKIALYTELSENGIKVEHLKKDVSDVEGMINKELQKELTWSP